MHIVRDWEQRELSSDVRRHIYDFIRSMRVDPNSSASVSTPLDPNTVYSKDNCPIVITPEIKDRDLHAHGNQTRPRPLVGRYVHNLCQKHLDAYLCIARYLIKPKDLRTVHGSHDQKWPAMMKQSLVL